MAWVGPAIAAGASLIGGLLGSSSEKKQQQRQIAFAREERKYNKPINVRKRAEEAGFNPLLFVGPGVGQANAGHLPGGSNNYMGSAIADIGLIAADAWKSKAAETSRIAQLEDENKELQKRLVDQTLRPPMGGMYQRGGPTIRQPEQADEAFGPFPLVNVRDANSGVWFGLDHKVAEALGKNDGDAWIGEDAEALLGEVGGNVNTLASTADGLLKRGPFDGPMYTPQLKAPDTVAPNLPPQQEVDWSATSGPNAPVKPKGMSDKAWERLVKKNRAIQGMAR